MVIFNSYVKLPEGIVLLSWKIESWENHDPPRGFLSGLLDAGTRKPRFGDLSIEGECGVEWEANPVQVAILVTCGIHGFFGVTGFTRHQIKLRGCNPVASEYVEACQCRQVAWHIGVPIYWWLIYEYGKSLQIQQ